jgi:hypothetical protein
VNIELAKWHDEDGSDFRADLAVAIYLKLKGSNNGKQTIDYGRYLNTTKRNFIQYLIRNRCK